MRLDAPTASCTALTEGTLLWGPGTGSCARAEGYLPASIVFGQPSWHRLGAVVARQLFNSLVLLIPQTFMLGLQIYL